MARKLPLDLRARESRRFGFGVAQPARAAKRSSSSGDSGTALEPCIPPDWGRPVVFFEESQTFSYVQPDRNSELIELSKEPSWRRIAYRR